MRLRPVLFAMMMATCFTVINAQHLPIYYGNSEISTMGYFNQGRIEVNFRFGHYIADTTQMGFYVDFQDSSFYTRTALGALFIKSFDTPTYIIPYVGAGLGYGNLERGPVSDKSGVELHFLLGFRYFLSEEVSLNSEFHAGVSSDDTFLDNSKAESLDLGFRIGLSYSW